jgi:hypothetical protein
MDSNSLYRAVEGCLATVRAEQIDYPDAQPSPRQEIGLVDRRRVPRHIRTDDEKNIELPGYRH